MNQEQVAVISSVISRPHRPGTLDIGRRSVNCTRVPPINLTPLGGNSFSNQEVFEENPEAAGFELNVNVACNPVKNTGKIFFFLNPFL